MKIVQIIDEPWDSGITHYALSLAHGLTEQGHAVTVWALRGAFPFEAAERLGLSTQDCRRPWLRFWKLRRWLIENKIELLHAHTGSAHVLACLLAAALKPAPKVVRSWSDSRLPQRRPGRLWLLKRTDGLIAANRLILSSLAAQFPFVPATEIFQGIRWPSPAPMERPPGAPLAIGIVGRLDPVKGHVDFLKAAALVLKRFPDARFLLAGGQANLSRRDLEALAADLGISGSVRFLGRVPSVSDFMRGCDIGVVASTGSEAVSRAALEWMASRRPVLATRVGCLPEIFEAKMPEAMTPAGNSGAMAEKLSAWLANPALRESLAQRAYERFVEIGDFPNFIAATLAFYRSVSAPPARSRRLTVFHVDGERGFRGGERLLLDLAKALRARGHRNVVVCRQGSALQTRAGIFGFETLGLPFSHPWDIISAWRLRKALKRSPASSTVVHAHSAHGANLARAASLGLKTINIAHRHVDFPVSSRLSLWWKYAGAQKVIAVSQRVKNVMVASGAEPGHIRVVHAGLDLEALPLSPSAPPNGTREKLCSQLHIPPQGPWIGNVAALVDHKDQTTLIEAMRRVAEIHPTAQLLIVGKGELEGRLKALVQEFRLQGRVHFTGFQEDPLSIMRALDLFVLSSHMEGLGLVLLEAMACSVPIVATRAGGIPEIVQEGVSGVLVPPRNPEQLAQAILGCLNDPEKRKSLAAGGKDRLKDFTAKRMAREIEEVYLSC